MGKPEQALALLDELIALGFPEDLFCEIHPFGHSVATYRAHCAPNGVPRRRFTKDSSSHALCDRMQMILDAAVEGGRPRGEEPGGWRHLVDASLERHPIARSKPNGEGATRARRHRQKQNYSRLQDQHGRFIADQIAALVPVAAEVAHPMSRVARWQIKNHLWRWTVDAIDAEGFSRIDAARRTELWPISERAAQGTAKIIHEHVVPRDVLVSHMIANDLRAGEAVFAALRHHCLAAVITKDEHDELEERGLKKTMPTRWVWGGDPWARYKEVGLYERLRWPEDWPDDLPGGRAG